MISLSQHCGLLGLKATGFGLGVSAFPNGSRKMIHKTWQNTSGRQIKAWKLLPHKILNEILLTSAFSNELFYKHLLGL